MKKMRKLLPAFAMLLVSAVMLSTASFAWFTQSASVTATGMQVKAQAAGGLVMSAALKADEGYEKPTINDYAANINLADTKWYINQAARTAAIIQPTSTDGKHWYSATAGSADSQLAAKDQAGNFTGYTTLADAADNVTANSGYYLATKLFFKAIVEETNHDLKITGITVTDTTNNLDQSLRVALKVGNNWFYFAPNYDGGTTPTLGHTTSTTEVKDTQQVTTYSVVNYTIGSAAGNLQVGATPNTVLCTNLTNDTVTEVEVYIYYEGEDPNCKSAYTANISELSISLDFTAIANDTTYSAPSGN